jgi:hypothetical protein
MTGTSRPARSSRASAKPSPPGRKEHVEDGQVGCGGQDLVGRDVVSEAGHGEAVAAQRARQRLADGRFVLHEHDPRRRRGHAGSIALGS